MDPKAFIQHEDTDGAIRVPDPTNNKSSVVPSDITGQHSEEHVLECNAQETSTSVSKKNKKAKSKQTRIRASKASVKRSKRGTLVDRGANGGILGNDAKVIFRRKKSVDVTGIDNHELSSLPMVDATAKTITNKGPVILILRNYAYHGINRTLHSAGQIEHFGNKVYDHVNEGWRSTSHRHS